MPTVPHAIAFAALPVIAVLNDWNLPTWFVPVAASILALLWGYLWFNADKRYVKREQHKEDVATLEKKIEILERQSKERDDLNTEYINRVETAIKERLDDIVKDAGEQHAATRAALHEIRNVMNSNQLALVEKVSTLAGELKGQGLIRSPIVS